MTTSNPALSGQRIALICISLSSALSIIVFFVCRFDHDMKLLALGNVLGQVTALMATASTMLVGRDFSGSSSKLPPASELPAGVVATATETLQTPPIDPAASPNKGTTEAP